ncbi:hypothetical protein ACHAWF_016654 [Thalassiosira exigua]
MILPYILRVEANVSKCCNAILCTECYLQIKPGKDRHCICPFCNNPKMTVTVAKGMDEGDVAKREEEEQRVIEATIRSRISELHGESPAPSEGGGGGQPNSEETESEGSFGSSLAEYNRARTFSSASNGSGVGGTGAGDPAGPGTPVRHVESGDDSDSSQLAALAMTPEARRALESEMRAQLSHETHMRMENEAEEARMRHTQEWYGSHRGSRARMREARLAELTGMLERMSARGGVGAGAVGGGDENARGGGGPLMAGRGDGTDGISARGEVAIHGRRGAGLSRLLRAMEGGGGRNLEDLMRLEAAFFLGMDDPTRGGDGASRGTSPLSRGRYSRNEDDEDDSDDDNEAGGRDGVRGQEPIRPIPPFALGPLPGSRRTVHRSRGGRSGGGRGVSTTHLDTAELLMQGVSEEEQLAMAIAMSMQDEQQRRQQQQQEEDGHGATISEGRGEGGRQPLDARPMGEEGGDGSSSDSSSSDSSEEGTGEGGVGNRGDTNAESLGGNGTVSLDEDEEEVVFAEV